jgi:hypothetical protein
MPDKGGEDRNDDAVCKQPIGVAARAGRRDQLVDRDPDEVVVERAGIEILQQSLRLLRHVVQQLGDLSVLESHYCASRAAIEDIFGCRKRRRKKQLTWSNAG